METTTNTSFEKKWLVKSEQRILGPFSYEQIEELLKKKQISLLDEIRDMERRWTFIREVPEFKPLVEVIRREVDQASELTQTLQTKTNQETKSITRNEASVTVEIPSSEPIETNGETNVSNDLAAIAKAEEQSIASNPSQPIVPANANFNRAIDVPFRETQAATTSVESTRPSPEVGRTARYGSTLDQRVQTEMSRSNRSYLLGFVTAVIGIGLGFWFWQNQKIQNEIRIETESVNQIKRHAMAGYNSKVVEHFAKLSPALQQRVLPDLISYFPLFRDYGITSRPEFIQSFQQKNQLNNEKKAQLELFQFYNAMTGSDFDTAQKHLVSAVNLNPMSEVVLENEAIFSLVRGNYPEARRVFEKLMGRQDGMVQGRWIYGLMISIYKQNQFEDFRPALEMIGRHLYTRMDYGRELRLFQIFLAKKDGNRTLFESSLKDYLSSPLQVGGLFRNDPLLYLNGYEASIQDELVEKIQAKQKGFEFDRLISFFVASYALEKNRFEQVERFLKSNVSESKSSDYASLEFQFLFLQNRKPEAYASISGVDLSSLWVYTRFLIVRGILETKSFTESHGDLLSQIEPGLQKETGFVPNYISFLRKWHSTTPDRVQKIREFLDVNLTLSPDFIPYIMAKSEISS